MKVRHVKAFFFWFRIGWGLCFLFFCFLFFGGWLCWVGRVTILPKRYDTLLARGSSRAERKISKIMWGIGRQFLSVEKILGVWRCYDRNL